MKLLSLQAVTSEGGLLPIDLLARVHAGDHNLPGLEREHYYLQKHERLNEAAERAWTRVLSLWRGFQEALGRLPEDNHATAATQDRWLLPLFEELGYGRLDDGEAHTYEGRTLQASHQRKNSPIHLVGRNVDLDRKSEAPGARIAPPHGLLQELLNREKGYLWGFVSNGRTLRVLRDHHSLTRQAYVAFDLEQILLEERFSEFFLLWLVCHQSRVDADPPAHCYLELWLANAREQGISALGALRLGVTRAIEALGEGFLAHPANSALHAQLKTGELDKQDYYRHLLRLIYRLIFLFVAEERNLLLDPAGEQDAKDSYWEHYALRRLRVTARTRAGGAHVDLWRGLRLVMGFLAEGQPLLALPALGSALWSPGFCGMLDQLELSNRYLLKAVRELAFTREGRQTYPVNWNNVGADELGGVYESLLELHPEIDKQTAHFKLTTAAGNDRKTSGSYYTPPTLVDQLLETALDPVLDRACRAKDPEAAILALTICDPSCGSGHFLVAAAHRTAKRLAAVRTGDAEPSPEPLRTALRDVIGACIHGVDLNPMTVELCKLSLWLEALEPGKPLSYLDHHIQVGNSLLGTTPALMLRGIPDKAFSPIGDDDKKTALGFSKQHRIERSGQTNMFAIYNENTHTDLSPIIDAARKIETQEDGDLEGVRHKEAAYGKLVRSATYRNARFKAHLWCAALVWPKPAPGPELDRAFDAAVPTEATWQTVISDPGMVTPLMRQITEQTAGDYAFFHWHLAFPHVFGEVRAEIAEDDLTGWTGGFDVILGNPPWERIKLQEKEWFAQRNPEIAGAKNAAARKKAIAALSETEQGRNLFQEWRKASRQSEGESTILRQSGRYPLCARGDINTYTIFTELDRTSLAPLGRMGVVVPGGIAMDATTQYFFQDLVASGSLHSLYHFENEAFIFPGVHHSVRFCLLTLTGSAEQIEEAEFVSYARQVTDLKDEARIYRLSQADFNRMNPNTRTLPAFRLRRDAEINRGIYERVPILWDEQKPEGNPWALSFMTMLHMSNDSGLFRDEQELVEKGWQANGNRFERDGALMLPLYEAKMIHHFNHRFGSYEGQTEAQARQGKLPESNETLLNDPDYQVKPRYWVASAEVTSRLQERWNHSWLFGWRDICRSTDVRTVIPSIIPRCGTGDTFLLAFLGNGLTFVTNLSANLTSFVLDFAARQKIGGTHLKYFVFKQLPVLAPQDYERVCTWSPQKTVGAWLRERSLELIYTSWELEPLAKSCAYQGPPFRYNDSRRAQLRAELDAAFFHLYGINRDDVAYIMDSFWVVRQKDEKAFGDYRTKLMILHCYDRMAEAVTTGRPYVTIVDPPPSDPSQSHPASEVP